MFIIDAEYNVVDGDRMIVRKTWILKVLKSTKQWTENKNTKLAKHVDREKPKQISEHLKRLLGRFGKKDGSQKWRMKEKLVNKRNDMNLIETLSTTFFFLKVSALLWAPWLN